MCGDEETRGRDEVRGNMGNGMGLGDRVGASMSGVITQVKGELMWCCLVSEERLSR